MKKPSHSLLHSLVTLALLLGSAKADPQPLQDYCIADASQPFFLNGAPCINPSLAASSHFTTSALSKPGDTKANPFGFSVKLTNVTNLPGAKHNGPDHGPARPGPEWAGPAPLPSTGLGSDHLHQGYPPCGLCEYEQLSVHATLEARQNPGTQIASLAAFTSKPPLPDEVLKRSFQISNQDVARIRRSLG
uniref:Cupin type-1 domain-containing protein n=1 Tax=Salix viminalis TaxID=40686 RepID=A0A6N2N668_SALVM